MIDDMDLTHLRRCVELARMALQTGNKPFGSVLVGADWQVLFEDHNRDSDGDATQHPEFAIARWAATNLEPGVRPATTVYTSGEHCAMCAAAHAWVGLGRIVYASSSTQLSNWLRALDVPAAPVRTLSITEVAPDIPIDGPVEALADEVHELQRSYFQR